MTGTKTRRNSRWLSRRMAKGAPAGAARRTDDADGGHRGSRSSFEPRESEEAAAGDARQDRPDGSSCNHRRRHEHIYAHRRATNAIKYATPLGWAYDLTLGLAGLARKPDDPPRA